MYIWKESGYSPAPQASGSNERRTGRAYRMSSTSAVVHQAKEKHEKTFTHPVSLSGGRARALGRAEKEDHGDESKRLARVDAQKLCSSSDKESIVSYGGKWRLLWHFCDINAALSTCLAPSLPSPGGSLYIKMHSAPYLNCIWTVSSSETREMEPDWVSVSCFEEEGNERSPTDGKMRDEASTRESVQALTA